MQKRCFNHQGQSTVEAALVLPVVLILFLGIVEVGFFLLAHVQVANAAREGARYASLCRLNHNCDNLTQVVKSSVFAEAQLLRMTDVDAGGNTGVVVEPPILSVVPTVGSPVTVTVTYQYVSPFVSNLVPMFPAQLPIQHTVVMNFDK